MNKKITLGICALFIVLGIFGYYLAVVDAASTPNDGQMGKPSGNSGGAGMGMTQDNSVSIVTDGAYVVDGPQNSTDMFTNLMRGFLAFFGVESYDVSETGKTYTATQADQSAIVVNGSGSLEINQATVNKNQGATSSADNSNFYGLNAALMVKTNSTLKVSNSKITTSVEGANGIFSTGDNAKTIVDNVKIVTSANSSRGLDATYNGTIIANSVQITTKGAHCAALATDRGEGTVMMSKGTLQTAGEGSPGIYSTGNITVIDTTSTSTGSEAAAIEGKNSITLTNCDITGCLKHGVMIYQSMSGDASVGSGIFSMTGGSLTAKTGPLFYSTNTKSIINLENVELKGIGALLNASSGSWGTSGSNGADVTFNAKNQVLKGAIDVDSISTLKMTLTDKSSLTSTINSGNTAKSITLNLSSDSTWDVTGNSYLTVLIDENNSLSNINDNGHIIYYDSSNSQNSWLNGHTKTLKDGGKLTPI